jgi:hypothetical protein
VDGLVARARGGMKFQQHNSSSKKDDQMRRGGVSLIALEAKRGALMMPSVGNQEERKTLEGGRPI